MAHPEHFKIFYSQLWRAELRDAECRWSRRIATLQRGCAGTNGGCNIFKEALKRNRGFTLVELLVAMAILAIIILLMAQLFTGSTKAWDLGMNHAEQNMTGRSLMDFMVREISQAVADDKIRFRHEDNIGMRVYGSEPDDLYFVSMNNNAQSGANARRELSEVYYYVEPMINEDDEEIPGRYRLRRMYTAQVTCLRTNEWWKNLAVGGFGDQVLAENVASFDVYCYRPDIGPDAISDYLSSNNGDQLPTYVDIALAVFDEKAAAEAQMKIEDFGENEHSAGMRNFVKEKARRYVARVYFVNRNGYGPER